MGDITSMADAPDAERSVRRRFPAEQRIALLTELAAEAFAEKGYGLATREIARHCGVTQALLYKYFGSKAKLIEAVLEQRFLSSSPPPDGSLLTGPGPLADRIARFYADFVARATEINMRLFLRAALDGLDLPARYGARLDQRVLRPVLNALRAEAGLPPAPDTPLPPAERELAMMLHGSAVFSLIRREIYGMTLPCSHAELIAQHVRIWVPGALAEITRLARR